MRQAPSGISFSDLVKSAERLVDTIPHRDDLSRLVLELSAAITNELGARLGVTGGRVYERVEGGGAYGLVDSFGRASSPEDPPLLLRDYPPVETCCLEGVVYMESDDPSLDRELENALGVGRFAAIEVDGEEFLLAFDLDEEQDREGSLLSLGILRYAINQKIRRERMDDVLRQARDIQSSILPRRVPAYGSFDVAGRNDPLETVGGDFYDFIPISDKILGVAIADVCGHGLPAALQVRDIYVGMRMGLGRDYKIVRTVERLNGIIHQSILTSRFVSMFYGELELNGNFLYVNAGHPPPFHLSAAGEVSFLESGGVVLGPVPDATYERGFVALSPGDLLVLYTDGIVEAVGAAEEEYGVDRIVSVARRHRLGSSQEIVDSVFSDVESFSTDDQASDDRTVVVVRYPELSS